MRANPSSATLAESADSLLRTLAEPADPVLVYKARVLLGADPTEVSALRDRIADAPMAHALLRVFDQDEKTLHHVYRKWQGPHWSLVSFALLDFPPGDERLLPLVSRVHDWLFSKHFLESPLTEVLPGQENRVRHCASMDGNALWYCVHLGVEEERTAAVAERLIGWQWPDGGWNCDKRGDARSSSFQESLIPARGLWAYGQAHDHEPSRRAAQRVADLVLERRLLWHRGDGSLIVPDWAGRPGPDRIHWPIQFFDALFALQVMCELGRIDDPRCTDALDLLASRQLPDGGFPAEATSAVPADAVVSRGTYADWGPSGMRTSNPLVTLAALAVLRQAGRC